MKPQEIKAALIRNSEKQVAIARDLGVSQPSINRVIEGKSVSFRIQKVLAERARVPFEKMWGKAA